VYIYNFKINCDLRFIFKPNQLLRVISKFFTSEKLVLKKVKKENGISMNLPIITSNRQGNENLEKRAKQF